TIGSAVGTPLFMSPEQAASGQPDGLVTKTDIGPASDIYSLGATLYQILTGRYCVAGRSKQEVMEDILAGRIVPIRPANPEIHPAIEAICLKALALRSQDRYASAKELAADVRRYRKDQPVSACRDPWHETIRRWCKRHRTFVTSAAAALVVSMIGLAVAWQRELSSNQQLAEVNGQLESSNTQLAAQNIELQRPRYATQIELAERLRQENDLAAANRMLDETPENIRGIEWRYLKDASRPAEKLKDASDCVQASLSGDGSLLATMTRHSLTPRVDIQVIDTRTGQTKWSQTIATTQYEENSLGFIAKAPRLLFTYVPGPDHYPSAFDYPAKERRAKDGQEAASSESIVTRMWDAQSGKRVPAEKNERYEKAPVKDRYQILNLTGAPGVQYRRAGRSFEQLFEIQFSPRADKPVERSVWPPGPQASVTISARSPVVCAALSNDSSMAATAHQNGSIRVWSVPHGRLLNAISSDMTKVLDLEFLPDRSGLVWIGEDKSTKPSGDAILRNRDGVVNASRWIFPALPKLVNVAQESGWPAANDILRTVVSSDGQRVAFLSASGSASVWDISTAKQIFACPLPGLAEAIREQANPYAASLGLNPEVWYYESETERHYDIALSTDGTLLAIATRSAETGNGSTQQVEVIAVESGAKKTLVGYCGPLALDPVGRKLAAGVIGTPGITLLDLQNGQPVCTLGVQTTPFSTPEDNRLADAIPRCLAFSPDGQRLVMVLRAGSGDEVHVWETIQGGARERRIQNAVWDRYGGIENLTFSPDGTSAVVTFYMRSVAHVLATSSWSVSSVIGTDAPLANIVAFSPDGKRLAKTGRQGEVEIWDAQTGNHYWTLIDRRSPTETLTFLAFSADGQTLAVGTSSGIRHWSH
ncbi:MAG: protein kinase family protein, partial [Planctomycetota bacterium]